VSNVDRTPRNTNMLVWHRRLWLIDHGAALYFHHAGGDYATRAADPFPRIADHVLLPFASALAHADAALVPRLTGDVIDGIVDLVPDAWLGADTARVACRPARRIPVATCAAGLRRRAHSSRRRGVPSPPRMTTR
jgi:hypothetical protein